MIRQRELTDESVYEMKSELNWELSSVICCYQWISRSFLLWVVEMPLLPVYCWCVSVCMCVCVFTCCWDNSVARTGMKAPKSCHITPILCSPHWLRITECIEYKLHHPVKKITDRSIHFASPCLLRISFLCLFVNLIMVPVFPFQTHIFLHSSLLPLLIHHSAHP